MFVACAVEAIEALTIVLASGLTRQWRSTLQGMAVALAVLAVVVAVVGPTITLLPLGALRLIVGALLAIFGLQWLRKAILRATGYKALHDEASAYLREVAAAKQAPVSSRRGVSDWYAFTLSFKGVLLEGLEVVFIVITFGDNQRNLGAAVIGAAAAIVVVAATGIAVRAPLSRVPENALKFAVGIMLTSFGTFWGAEGAGVSWPGSDAALLVIVPAVAAVSLGCVAWLTNGSVRDLEQVRAAGFQCFAETASVSHAYAHIVDFGEPVEIGGLKINPGDVLHGDLNGIHMVPAQIAAQLPDVVKRIRDREAELIRFCQSPDFSLEKLESVLGKAAPWSQTVEVH